MARSRHSDPSEPRQALPSAAFPAEEIAAIDALYAHAGLTRSLRGAAAGVTVRVRQARVSPQDLLPREPEPRLAPNGLPLLPVPGWDALGGSQKGWLWNGFSTRLGGTSTGYAPEGAPPELNLGFTDFDTCEAVQENRLRLVEAVTGSRQTPLVTIRQVHSNLVLLATAADASLARPKRADGLITGEPGLLLAVQTADCIPVLVADRRRRIVAAFHAGWRGTVKRIVESGIGRMRLEFGCRPEDLVAAIGPGVGPCCYAVGEEVRCEFESQFAYAPGLFHMVDDSDEIRRRYPMLFLTQRAPGHSPIGPSLHLDLAEANRRQLLSAGLKPAAIRLIGGCTSCHRRLFFSHRASQGHAGRMMAVVGIRPEA